MNTKIPITVARFNSLYKDLSHIKRMEHKFSHLKVTKAQQINLSNYLKEKTDELAVIATDTFNWANQPVNYGEHTYRNIIDKLCRFEDDLLRASEIELDLTDPSEGFNPEQYSSVVDTLVEINGLAELYAHTTAREMICTIINDIMCVGIGSYIKCVYPVLFPGEVSSSEVYLPQVEHDTGISAELVDKQLFYTQAEREAIEEAKRRKEEEDERERQFQILREQSASDREALAALCKNKPVLCQSLLKQEFITLVASNASLDAETCKRVRAVRSVMKAIENVVTVGEELPEEMYISLCSELKVEDIVVALSCMQPGVEARMLSTHELLDEHFEEPTSVGDTVVFTFK